MKKYFEGFELLAATSFALSSSLQGVSEASTPEPTACAMNLAVSPGSPGFSGGPGYRLAKTFSRV